MPIVVHPWRGEFGTMIMHHVRRVHALADPVKVVCCRRGDEALFPNAASFFYDWEELPDSSKNGRTVARDHDYQQALSAVLDQRYPHHQQILPIHKLEHKRGWNFKPAPRVRRGLTCDIAVAPRVRQHGHHRNFQHWTRVIDGLHAANLRVGLIGMASTSVDHPEVPSHLKGWTYDPLDAHLELMQNARLVLATDSGLAHLAVLAGAPLLVIYDQPGREAGHPTWPWVLPHMQAHAVTTCEPICYGWNDPDLVVRQVLDWWRRLSSSLVREAARA